MSRLTTHPFARNWAVTKMGLGTGARIAAHSVGNLFRSADARDDADRDFYTREAQVLADELGQLKGSIMKAGQMLSLYGQYFLPPEAVTVLSQLQDDTPPVDWRVIAPVLERALGRDKLAELDIDQTPLAAASLGQAHRARRRRDGRELVLKVQYPGVADAIESDITTLQRVIGMTRLAPKGLDMAPVFAEVREMLHREVDYVAERRYTEDFRKRLAKDARYIVPQTFGEYCSDQVLALSYEPGQTIRSAAVQGLAQAARNDLASAFIDLFLVEFFDWGMVQTDPHFGNYRIRIEDGAAPRIVLLDFGATRVFGRGFIDGYREIVCGALARDAARVRAGARRIGLMEDRFPEPVVQAFVELCELIVEPFRGDDPAVPEALRGKRDAYRWGASELPRRVAAKAARNALSRWFRVPPREIVFLHRRLAGVFIMAGALAAEISAGPLLEARIGASASGCSA